MLLRDENEGKQGLKKNQKKIMYSQIVHVWLSMKNSFIMTPD